jgi:transposase-like protein
MGRFKDLREVLIYFADEKVCWEYLEQELWDGKPVCPHCGNKKVYRLADGRKFKCGNKKTCDSKFTVLVGSIYENTKLPLSIWFGAIFLATSRKKGISSHQVARDLGITQKTAWFLLHRIRRMIKKKKPKTLAGVVQVDESYVKGEAKNRTAKKRKLILDGLKKDLPAIVVGTVTSEEAIMTVVPNAEKDTLFDLIRAIVTDKSSTVVTDGLPSYTGLSDLYKDHVIVNHAAGIFVLGEFHNQTVEGLFSILKRMIMGVYHYISPKHLQAYCDECTYRYNSRKITDTDRFILTMKERGERLRYADLIKRA